MPQTIHAVFIGINQYPQFPLAGCINDVLDLKEFFDDLVSANEDLKFFPHFYLAPDTEEESLDLKRLAVAKLKPNHYQAPTRENILHAFAHFDQAQAGDICLFYYSGHGSFQDAPKEFWHMKSAKQVETLVAVDSRKSGGQDIIDKELGYQIYQLTQKKDIHFLAIMDCCHAGDNTRGEEGVRKREVAPNRNKTPLANYFGYETGGNAYYRHESPDKIDPPFGEHVQLAASQEHETAKELNLDGRQRGVFTHFLIKALRNGGMTMRYNDLVRQVKMLVENRAAQQLPNAFIPDKLTHLSFLGMDSLAIPPRTFAVAFHEGPQQWIMDAGEMNGIYAPTAYGKTTVELFDLEQKKVVGKATVTQAKTNKAVLMPHDPIEPVGDNLTLRATVLTLATPALKIGIEDALKEKKDIKERIKESPYLQEASISEAAYIVRPLGKQFVLTKKGSQIPLFKRQASEQYLVHYTECVAKWLTLLGKENTATNIRREEITVTVETIEDTAFTLDIIDQIEALSKNKLINPDVNGQSIKLRYFGDQQPVMRVRVQTTTRHYYVAGYYLSSKFGISNPLETKFIKRDGNGEAFSFEDEYSGLTYKTLPIGFDENYHELGITTVTNYLKIFVSTESFDLSHFEQEELPLDDKTMRSIVMDNREARPKVDWMAITIPFEVQRQPELGMIQGQLQSGQEVEIGNLTLHCPNGFSAKVSLASRQHVEQLQRENEGVRSGSTKLNAGLLPPASLFAENTVGETVFFRDTVGQKDAQVSIVELEETAGSLDEENYLSIKTEGLNKGESILPFAYDAESGFYYPIGFTDEKGTVRIEQLPKPTPGKILNEGAVNTRSIGQSIKLFFKKLVWNPITDDKSLNLLRICTKEDSGEVRRAVVSEGYLNNPELTNIVLLIHGIIGNTQPLVDGFFKESDLYKEFDTVLSFDYENLNTKITDTAENLMDHLLTAGFFDVIEPKRRLTIVAHSMGGLVTRVMMEQESFGGYVKKLIQLGTPNGGSEISDFRKSVFGMLAMGLNGLTKFKPYIAVLTGISKKLGDQLFVTLNQMSPGSDFIRNLNSVLPGVNKSNYYLIAGDTSLISVERREEDPFWKVMFQVLRQKSKYLALNFFVFKDPNNDMAVRIEQMKKSGVPERNITILPVDHISYFSDEKVLKRLREIIQS
ncbi:MAG: caspase family protein [Bacteroidota bacterium]